MGVKEKDLQTVESLSAGDKIRIVTGGGNSKNIDAGAVGGGAFVVHEIYDEDLDNFTLDKTYSEIASAFANSLVPVLVSETSIGGSTTMHIACLESFSSGFCPNTQIPFAQVGFIVVNVFNGSVSLQYYGSDSEDGVLTFDYDPCEEKQI